MDIASRSGLWVAVPQCIRGDAKKICCSQTKVDFVDTSTQQKLTLFLLPKKKENFSRICQIFLA